MLDFESLYQMISPYIPELLGVTCFILGFIFLSQNQSSSQDNFELDYTTLITQALSDGHVERAIVFLEEQASSS
jgi:hypothetical protein